MEQKLLESRSEIKRVLEEALDTFKAKKLLDRARLEAVMEALPVGVCITDAQGGVVRFNRAYHDIWGGSPPRTDSVKDYAAYKAWHLETGKSVRSEEWASAQAVQGGKTVTGQLLEIERFDGSRLSVINSASPVYGPGGEITGSAVAMQDITGFRQTEIALKKSRFRFELLSKTANLLLTAKDPEGTMNDICLEVMTHLDCQVFFNFLADEKTGKLRLNAFSGIPDKEAQGIAWLDYGVAVCGSVARDQSPFVAHDIFHTPDARTDLVKSYGVRAYACHPIMSRDRLIGTLSFGTKTRDAFSPEEISLMKTVTDEVATAMERAIMIKELRKSRDSLERRVRERTSELEMKNRELQDFAFVASHDLQEPLRKIQSFGDLLLHECAPSISEDGRDYLTRMTNAATRMRTLIDSLLTYSRVSTQRQPFSKTDLADAVKEALANLVVRMEETGAAVEARELPVIEADRVQMVQLFQNLIANALKFGSRGTTPRIRIHSPTFQKGSFSGGGTTEIHVRDNGIGFDEAYLPRIFIPFQRLHGKSAYEGVGMGLAICKKIVERHHGRLTARSRPGQGATFIITLPTEQRETPSSAIPPEETLVDM